MTDVTDVIVDNTITIREKVISGKIPIQVVHGNVDHFKMVSRFSYLDTLATMILGNNICDFQFTSDNRMLNNRYPIGVLYDLCDPDILPWKLVLEKDDKRQRRDVSAMHMNALKHAEYIETGNVSKLTNMSKSQHLQLVRDMNTESYHNPLIMSIPELDRKVAIRIHFSDGQSLIVANKPDSMLFGIMQGILVDKTRTRDLFILKSVDNWLHVCFPNTVTESLEDCNKEITVTFRSVGSTPMIRNNIARFSETVTVERCKDYVVKQLGRGREQELYLYVDGMFLAELDEPLYNLTLRKKSTLTLYYSVTEAWV